MLTSLFSQPLLKCQYAGTYVVAGRIPLSTPPCRPIRSIPRQFVPVPTYTSVSRLFVSAVYHHSLTTNFRPCAYTDVACSRLSGAGGILPNRHEALKVPVRDGDRRADEIRRDTDLYGTGQLVVVLNESTATAGSPGTAGILPATT